MKKEAMLIATDFISKQLGIDTNDVHSYRDIKRGESLKPKFEVSVLWSLQVVDNWIFLIDTTLNEHKYYILTYEGRFDQWYIEIFKRETKFRVK